MCFILEDMNVMMNYSPRFAVNKIQCLSTSSTSIKQNSERMSEPVLVQVQTSR